MQNKLTLAALPLLTACGFPIDFEPFGCNKTDAECRNPDASEPTPAPEPTEPTEPTITELLKDEYERGFYASCRSANGTVLLRDSGAILHCDVPEVQAEPVSCPEPREGNGSGVDPDAGGDSVQPDVPAEPAPPSAGPYQPDQRPRPEPPVSPTRPAQVVPGKNWFDSYSHNGQCYVDTTYDHDVDKLVVPTSRGPLSVREIEALIGPGPGRAGNPQYNDVQCGNGPANNAGDEDQDVCPGRVDMGAAGCFIRGPKFKLPPEAGDLLVWHNDLAGDRDNLQASLAVSHYAKRHGLEIFASVGTIPARFDNTFFPGINDFPDAAWGEYLDARDDYWPSINASAVRWVKALRAGQDIAVIEGGTSGYTYRILKQVTAAMPALDTKRIRVYQHSVGGWNEKESVPSELAFIKSKVTYVKVPNGNLPGNGSADLQAKASEQSCKVFMQAAKATPEAALWQRAFDWQPDSRKCDFSDLVELLAAVGHKDFYMNDLF